MHRQDFRLRNIKIHMKMMKYRVVRLARSTMKKLFLFSCAIFAYGVLFFGFSFLMLMNNLPTLVVDFQREIGSPGSVTMNFSGPEPTKTGKLEINFETKRKADLLKNFTSTELKRKEDLQRKQRETYKKTKQFQIWEKGRTVQCGGNFIGYSPYFAHFRNLMINRTCTHSVAKGGELLSQVINQSADAEDIEIKKGFQTVQCPGKAKFKLETSVKHVHHWWDTLEFTQKLPNDNKNTTLPVENTFTILVTRYEYANVYWAVMEMYNAFILARFFNKSMDEFQIVLVDAKPKVPLDDLLLIAFHAKRLNSLPSQTVFRDLVWMFGRDKGPLLQQNLKTFPLVPEFRQSVLSAFNVPFDTHKMNCSRLNVLFIWRRNYMAHPRNPSGLVKRKIKNEEEVLTQARKTFPSFNITGVQLDLLSVKAQLELLARTDIMIGMHGAAFGFSIFLPPGGGVIEMFLRQGGGNWHMGHIAKANSLHHLTWKNNLSNLENTLAGYIRLQPNVTCNQILQMKSRICKNKT